MKRILFLLLFISVTLSLNAQVLAPGDIVIIGFNFDNPDEISFVCLEDIVAGTQLNFTDNGWFNSGSFRTGEGAFTYTFSSDVSAGTVIVPTVTSVAFAADGDQVFVYQGNSSSPSFIFGLNSEGDGVWQDDATSSNTSALPAGLTNGETAVALNEIDNAIYTGTTSGTRSELLTAICDKSNWSGHNTTRQTMPTGSFTIGGTISIPDAPVATAATNITHEGFTANWNASTGATTYYLDVSEANDFSAFVSGYENLNVGNFTTKSITGLTASNDYFYRVRANNSAGTSANSNIISLATNAQPATTIQFKNASGSVAENGGSYDITVSISFPDAVNATTANVVLTDGDDADIDSYTTTTLTFPAGSSADQTISVNITDDAVTEGNETLTFELQSASGGNSASVGTPSQFKLTIIESYSGNYYDPISAGALGEQLRFELYNLIKGHIEFPYTSYTTDVWDILMKSDEDPTNSENVILLYTGRSKAKVENQGVLGTGDPDAWNREHVWAKSRGDFGTDPPAGTDAHHLRPTDNTVNSARGNKDFDNGGDPVYDSGVLTDCFTDSDSWEPRDEVKGDVARMLFYMDVRYEGERGDPELHIVDYTGPLPDDYPPIIGKLETLLTWHAADPVDGFEQNRNNVVYGYQTNRNPFIDHPEWVDKIWGSTVPEGPSIASESRNVTVPDENQDLEITAVVTDNSSVSNVTIKYQVNGNAEQSLAMSSAGANSYTASIPENVYGNADLIKYYLVAEDDEGNFDYGFITEILTGITPISIIKTNGSDGRLVYKGVFAKVSGVATVESDVFSTTSLDVYVQDANHGVNIYKSGSITPITRGTNYLVSGQIAQFYGKTELVPENVGTDIINLGVGSMPDPTVLTIDQFLTDPETYEGMLVGIQHLTRTGGDTWPLIDNNASVEVSDGGVNVFTLRIDRDTEIDGSTEPAWPKDIVGIFNQYDDYFPYFDVYQIQPRDLSDFQTDGALPVELTTFAASVHNNTVSLNWITATEVNNYGFDVERASIPLSMSSSKVEARKWSKLDFVKGNGNSNSPKSYSFIDNSVSISGKYNYRLKQIDIDGKYEYSNEIEVEVGIPELFEVAQNYPNPFNPSTTISFSIPEKSEVSIQIYNMLGQKVYTLVNENLEAGKYSYNFDASAISSGTYIYRVTSGDNIETRKMLLIK